MEDLAVYVVLGCILVALLIIILVCAGLGCRDRWRRHTCECRPRSEWLACGSCCARLGSGVGVEWGRGLCPPWGRARLQRRGRGRGRERQGHTKRRLTTPNPFNALVKPKIQFTGSSNSLLGGGSVMVPQATMEPQPLYHQQQPQQQQQQQQVLQGWTPTPVMAAPAEPTLGLPPVVIMTGGAELETPHTGECVCGGTPAGALTLSGGITYQDQVPSQWPSHNTQPSMMEYGESGPTPFNNFTLPEAPLPPTIYPALGSLNRGPHDMYIQADVPVLAPVQPQPQYQSQPQLQPQPINLPPSQPANLQGSYPLLTYVEAEPAPVHLQSASNPDQIQYLGATPVFNDLGSADPPRTGILKNGPNHRRVRFSAEAEPAAVVPQPEIEARRPPEEELSFIVVGDWGKGNRIQKDVCEKMNEWAGNYGASFVLSAGDNFYQRGITNTTDAKVKERWSDVYQGQSMRHLRQLPWYLVLGDNDWDSGAQAQIDLTAQEALWNMPNVYHDVIKQFGDVTVHIVMFDTTAFEDPRHPQLRAEMLGWLDRTFANSQATWRFLVGHAPLYSAGKNGPVNEKLYDDISYRLASWKPDVFFSGHDHSLQFLQPTDGSSDTYYVVSAGGGAAVNWRYRKRDAHVETLRNQRGMDTSFFHYGNGFVGVRVTKEHTLLDYRDIKGKSIFSIKKARV